MLTSGWSISTPEFSCSCQHGAEIGGIDPVPPRADNQAVVGSQGEHQRLHETERPEPRFFSTGVIDKNSPIVGLDEFHSDKTGPFEEIPQGLVGRAAPGAYGHPVGNDPLIACHCDIKRIRWGCSQSEHQEEKRYHKNLLDDLDVPFHPFFPVAFEEKQVLVAVERIGAGLCWGKLDNYAS